MGKMVEKVNKNCAFCIIETKKNSSSGLLKASLFSPATIER